MTPSWAGRLFQIGYVVPDLAAAMQAFHRDLGIERFLVRRDSALRDQRFRGRPADFRQHIAFGFTGDTQVELIQPVGGPSTYTEFLDRCPEGGVQHLGYRVHDLAAASAEMDALGYRIVQSGHAPPVRLAYFEAARIPGTLIELIEMVPAEVEMFDRLKRGEIGSVPNAIFEGTLP